MRPDYLRLSVTAQCDLACFYCRPTINGDWRKRSEMPFESPAEISVSEIAFLVECAAAEGVRKVRITGGEPLLRPDLEEIIRAIGTNPAIAEVALTTNGAALNARAESLRRAGLRRINISLDTLRPERFRLITGQDRLGEVLSGIETAARTFDLVKINTVALRGINDDEIEALVRFAQRFGLHIRFIERYPSCGTEEPSERFLRGSEVKRLLATVFGPLEREVSGGPALEETYAIPSAGGVRVGLIAGHSHPPCSACGKLRFTAEGRLQSCLFSPPGDVLLPLLRARDAAAVRRAIRETFAAKPRTGPGPDASVPAPVNVVGG